MKIVETEAEFLRQLQGACLDPRRLDPWEAWRAFKAFLHREVEEVYDAASFQYGVFENDEGGLEASVFFVRQFTEWSVEEREDELMGRLVVELCYPPNTLPLFEDVDVWNLDFPRL